MGLLPESKYFYFQPGIPYVGWLLLVCTIYPANPKSKSGGLPKIVFYGGWLLMSLGLFISGIHKLQCKSWLNGLTMF